MKVVHSPTLLQTTMIIWATMIILLISSSTVFATNDIANAQFYDDDIWDDDDDDFQNIIPSSSCTDTPNWVDTTGDSCSFYETMDTPGCPLFGTEYAGTMGTANENCCHCQLTSSPTMAPTISKMPTTPFPTRVDDHLNNNNNNDITSRNGIHTYGGATQPPTGTWELHRIDNNNCIQNTPDWTDYFGDDCSWYEENDMPGCPTYGMDYVGSMGVAFDNCCYCMLDLLDLV